MTTDDRNRPAQTRPGQPQPAEPRAHPTDAIRIRELRFAQPGGPASIPLSNSGGGRGSITARDKDGTRITIQFEPALRHHRVREIRQGKLAMEFLIPESWVMAIPEEQPAEPSAP